MKILITGGCGFIGSNLVHYLQAADPSCSVSVLDLSPTSDYFDSSELSGSHYLGCITDDNVLAKALKGKDLVIHLAAHTRVIDSIENPRENFRINAQGSLNLFQAALQADVSNVICASTGGAIVGSVEPPVSEETNPKPLSPYGASKLSMEGYASAFNGTFGMNIACLRFSNVFGPFSFHKQSAVALLMKAALLGERFVVYGDGSQTRDYLYVEDLCGAIAGIVNKPLSDVVQIASGVPTELNAVIDSIISLGIGLSRDQIQFADFREGEVKHTWCEIAKAKRILGFEPTNNIDAPLRTTALWFQDFIARTT